MLISISWKNVWRNKIRSLVVIISVMLGIIGGVMATGIMQGWIVQRIHSSIYNETAHVQIHNPDFLFNEELQFTINNFDQITATLDTIPEVIAYSPRTKIFAMVQTDWAASGLMLKGVIPEKEIQVSEIHKNLVEGEFLDGKHRLPSIVIGSKAAETLKLLNYQVTPEKLDSLNKEEYSVYLLDSLASFGKKRFRKEIDFRNALKAKLPKTVFKKHADELINYFSFYRLGTSIRLTIQNKEGDITNPVFKVRGIYKTNNTQFDGLNAYVNFENLKKYTDQSYNEMHEIAIITTDNEAAINLGAKLAAYFPENSVMDWKRISPEIAMYSDFTGIMGLIYVGIILFALAFGIINTMLMSVLERTKELGMLMAIGMNKKRVFTMIMFESVFLTLTGALTGMLVSGVIVHITNKTGINFRVWAEGFEALGYSSVVYPIVTMKEYASILLMVIFTGMIASIWPARKALKLKPVEALRTD
jgi:ABC-type lipoprotein release transport system permease subunit